MTINTLDDLFRGGKFYYYYDKSKLIKEKRVFELDLYNESEYDKSRYPTQIHWILANARLVYEWWIELDPKVIEEVNREFDLSK